MSRAIIRSRAIKQKHTSIVGMGWDGMGWDGMGWTHTHRTSSSSCGPATGLFLEREPPGAAETVVGAGPAEDDASLSPAIATRRDDERWLPAAAPVVQDALAF